MVAIPNKEWFVKKLKKENKGRFVSNKYVDTYMKKYQEEADREEDYQDELCLLAGYGY